MHIYICGHIFIYISLVFLSWYKTVRVHTHTVTLVTVGNFIINIYFIPKNKIYFLLLQSSLPVLLTILIIAVIAARLEIFPESVHCLPKFFVCRFVTLF